MSNTIANHLYIYGPQEHVDSFLAAFLRDGMKAHVPIPADAEPSEDPVENLRSRWEQIHVDHWGAFWIGPDIYWTCGGAFGVSMLTKDEDRVFQPEELQLANVRKLDLTDRSKSLKDRPVYLNSFIRPVWASWSERPGCVAPSKEDAIAYCKFYSPWSPPFKWFGKVATDLYAIGLRFVMDSIDLTNMGQDGSHEIVEFWSVDGPGKFYQDGHWASCIETVDNSDDATATAEPVPETTA